MKIHIESVLARAGEVRSGNEIFQFESSGKILSLPSKSRFVFLIPITRNDNKKFSKQLYQWLFQSLLSLAGGFNFLPSFGGWINVKGIAQYEKSLRFTVGIDCKKILELFHLLKEVKDKFLQEVLYVEFENKILFL